MVLVLTRKPTESLIFSDGEIKIKILGVYGEKVRLGIEAPKSVSVYRDEVWERLQNPVTRVRKMMQPPSAAAEST